MMHHRARKKNYNQPQWNERSKPNKKRLYNLYLKKKILLLSSGEDCMEEMMLKKLIFSEYIIPTNECQSDTFIFQHETIWIRLFHFLFPSTNFAFSAPFVLL